MNYCYLLIPYQPDSSSAVFGIKQVVCIVFILVFIAVASSWHTELEINQDMRRFRKVYTVFGLKIGNWQPLPTVVGVTIKYFATVARSNSKYSWNTSATHSEEIIVMLSIQNSSNGLVIGRFSADSINAAIDFAHDTAERFNVFVNTYLPPNQFTPI